MTVRAHAQQIVQRVEHFALPWVMLGDFNLQTQDLSMVLSNGWARALDEAFEMEGPFHPVALDKGASILALRRKCMQLAFLIPLQWRIIVWLL